MLERHVAVDQTMVRIHHFVIVRECLRLIALSDGRRLQGRSGLPFAAVVVLQHPVFHTGSGCACVELGVDDRVAVNGLGYQAVERALRAFAVDGVKAHRQSGERGQIGQERGERRNGAAAGGVEGQEQVFAAGERRIGDAAERAVEAGQAGENQQREHQLETRAVKMIGQLLMI